MDKKTHRTTIKDVALLAGVSPSTVSLVLNNSPLPVAEETRLKVLECVKKLDYRPNQIARSMVKRRTSNIGLVVPDYDNIFLCSYSNKLSYHANNRGYNLILRNSNKDPKIIINALRLFEDQQVDAVILMQSEFDSKEDSLLCRNTIKNLKIPILLIDRVPQDLVSDSVIFNHFKCGLLATEHLIKNGHRQIGYISAPLFMHLAQQRLEGHKQALENAGIPFDESLVCEGELQLHGGMGHVQYLLEKGCTAFAVFNDMMCYGVMRELKKLGLSVPNDVSIIGCDDLVFSEIASPTLTTLEQPLDAMAEATINRVIDIINNSINNKANHPQHIVFDPVLKVRESVKNIAR